MWHKQEASPNSTETIASDACLAEMAIKLVTPTAKPAQATTMNAGTGKWWSPGILQKRQQLLEKLGTDISFPIFTTTLQPANCFQTQACRTREVGTFA
jgi:hypothetical protein